MRRYASIGVGIAACLALLSCAPPPPPPSEVWPTAGWPSSTPEAQGIDSGALAVTIDTLKANHVPIHSLLVERNGYIVLDSYFFPFGANQPHDVASITKSVTSTLVGIAMGDDASVELNSPIASLLPEQEIADPRKARITLAQLLGMTSGLDCSAQHGVSLLLQMEMSAHWTSYLLSRPLVAEPGSRFDYCAGNMQLVSASLTRATGESASELAHARLFAPLGITKVIWPADPDGNSHGFADLMLESRDLAKLGYLWLHQGRWEGRQIVPAAYLATALSPHANVQPGVQYGYGMWLYPGHTPYDFEANGRGGQRITVIPQLNAVVVVTGGGMDANRIAPLIARAFVSKAALPANSTGEARLASAVARAAAAPRPYAALPLPAAAGYLAAKTWFLPANPLGVQSLTLSFPSAVEASVRFGFADGTGEDHSVGLDGSPRLSRNVSSGLPVAVSGQWRNGGFELDYDEVARINAYRFSLVPASGGVFIHLTERSGLANITMTATDEPPAEPIAAGSGNHG
ncbi:MAG TPA: serine hydrolase [Rhizomicrobium sp.]